MTYGQYAASAQQACNGYSVPTITYPNCPADVKVHLSQVTDILIVEPSSANNLLPATKPTADTAAAWAAEMSQTATGKIRKMQVVGSISEPTPVKVEVNGEERTIFYEFKLEVSHHDITAENYAFLRSVLNRDIFTWIKLKGGGRFGAFNDPIKATVTTASPVGGAGKNDILSFKFVFEWRHANLPDFVISSPV